MFQEYIMAAAPTAFPPNAFDIMQGIIINQDSGRFMDVTVDKPSCKNLRS